MTLYPEYYAPIDAGTRVTADVRPTFDREWRQTCPCPELDVLERNGTLRCGGCDAPILRRRRTEARS